MTTFLAIFATLMTSLISGVLSMAGGMILMGVLGFLFALPLAMVVHGVAQATSNGSRIWLYRRHIRWKIFLPYCLGTAIVLIVFVTFRYVPDLALVFLLIGSFPFLTFIIPQNDALDIERKSVAFFCGLLVTTVQMLAGASGPVLDTFYVQSKLTRYEVMGTKAITQTLGHLVKLGYYSVVPFLILDTSTNIGANDNEVFLEDPIQFVMLFPGVVLAAMAGNRAGQFFLERINDHLFRRTGRIIVLVIGMVYIGKGCFEWLNR